MGWIMWWTLQRSSTDLSCLFGLCPSHSQRCTARRPSPAESMVLTPVVERNSRKLYIR